jgi:hypothetical protein
MIQTVAPLRSAQRPVALSGFCFSRKAALPAFRLWRQPDGLKSHCSFREQLGADWFASAKRHHVPPPPLGRGLAFAEAPAPADADENLVGDVAGERRAARETYEQFARGDFGALAVAACIRSSERAARSERLVWCEYRGSATPTD